MKPTARRLLAAALVAAGRRCGPPGVRPDGRRDASTTQTVPDAFEAGEFRATGGNRLPCRLLRPIATPRAPACPPVVVLHRSGEIGTDKVEHMNSPIKVWARP